MGGVGEVRRAGQQVHWPEAVGECGRERGRGRDRGLRRGRGRRRRRWRGCRHWRRGWRELGPGFGRLLALQLQQQRHIHGAAGGEGIFGSEAVVGPDGLQGGQTKKLAEFGLGPGADRKLQLGRHDQLLIGGRFGAFGELVERSQVRLSPRAPTEAGGDRLQRLPQLDLVADPSRQAHELFLRATVGVGQAIEVGQQGPEPFVLVPIRRQGRPSFAAATLGLSRRDVRRHQPPEDQGHPTPTLRRHQ
jgi:hypothetical protein